MTKQIHLTESVTEAPVKKGNRWRVVVARPGVGSSGTYSEELFRRDAHKIVPAGAQAFINHDSTRNPKDMLGVYPEPAYFDESENAVIAELEVFSHWKDFVEEVGPHCGISLYALGEADEYGNVTKIYEDRQNGADLVSRPGLIGSGIAEKLYESATSHSDTKPTVTVAEKERNNMELEAKVDQALEILAGLVADKAEKAAEAVQVTADADAAKIAAESAVAQYAAAVEAVEAADLFESQRKDILAKAIEGADISALIESAKTVREEAVKAVTESADQGSAHGVVLGGRQVESATDLGKAFG